MPQDDLTFLVFREQILLTTLMETRTSLDEPIRDQLSLITESLFNDGLYHWDGV
jgi:hypothetical protein